MSGNRKVTPAQRDELMRIYFAEGPAAAVALCLKFGVARTYAAKQASEMGLVTRKKARLLPPEEKAEIRGRRYQKRASDPRWARAIAVGGVLA